VDDVREVIENAQYMPTRGRYKVYLIDEVHMLSKAAFNALLKTLEEPQATLSSY
jgi:DNA polymerase-3 subunit gamma/tau